MHAAEKILRDLETARCALLVAKELNAGFYQGEPKLAIRQSVRALERTVNALEAALAEQRMTWRERVGAEREPPMRLIHVSPTPDQDKSPATPRSSESSPDTSRSPVFERDLMTCTATGWDARRQCAVYCARPSGHDGEHQDRDGAFFQQQVCGSTLEIRSGMTEEDVVLSCCLAVLHDGNHYDVSEDFHWAWEAGERDEEEKRRGVHMLADPICGVLGDRGGMALHCVRPLDHDGEHQDRDGAFFTPIDDEEDDA